MAHTYSHLYGIPTTGLRFFTVYGPFGRPDMAYFSFTKAILSGSEINVFNNGDMKRDFTYIDDIIESIVCLIDNTPSVDDSHQQARHHFTGAQAPYHVYNIGNNRPITLSRFISAIESACGSKAIKKLLPMQSGDVPITYANIDPLILDIKFKPETEIETGICKFVSWYNEVYS
jgi:UDP-glucuronate 4-epimerase